MRWSLQNPDSVFYGPLGAYKTCVWCQPTEVPCGRLGGPCGRSTACVTARARVAFYLRDCCAPPWNPQCRQPRARSHGCQRCLFLPGEATAVGQEVYQALPGLLPPVYRYECTRIAVYGRPQGHHTSESSATNPAASPRSAGELRRIAPSFR